MTAITWLNPHDPPDAFPPVARAIREPDGLLAAGGDLSPARLQAAYRRGIFPWFSRGQPILWWSPDPRTILIPKKMKVSRSLGKSIRNSGFEIKLDTAFEAVMRACGDKELRSEGTWIGHDMCIAYGKLHQLGLAHSVEVWRGNELVGGLYGVALGHIFYGESMFSRARDASKVALKALCDELIHRNFELVDCQMATPHLMSLGAQLMPRREFTAILDAHAQPPDSAGIWQFTKP